MAKELTSAEQAAMFLMSLEDDQAAELLRHMSDEAAGKLREAARRLDSSRISSEQKRQALLGFVLQRRQGTYPLGNPEERFRQVLVAAKGEDAVRRIYGTGEAGEGAEQTPKEKTDLEFIAEFPEDPLAKAVADESPRCVALLLSKLGGSKAGRVLNQLDEERREAVLERMLSGETVPPEVAEDVMKGFREKLERISSGAEVASEEKRAQELAEMIGALEQETQDAVLARLAEEDPEMAERIERLIFGFEDLLKVGERSMQELLRNLEVTHVALALKGAESALYEHFMKNLSQRQRERVEEEREMAGRVPMSQVEEAREEIMKLARRMYRDRELVVEMGDEQYVE